MHPQPQLRVRTDPALDVLGAHGGDAPHVGLAIARGFDGNLRLVDDGVGAVGSLRFRAELVDWGDLAGINHRNVTFKLLSDDLASTESSIYSFESLLADGFTYTWSKVDGKWYSDSSCD